MATHGRRVERRLALFNLNIEVCPERGNGLVRCGLRRDLGRHLRGAERATRATADAARLCLWSRATDFREGLADLGLGLLGSVLRDCLSLFFALLRRQLDLRSVYRSREPGLERAQNRASRGTGDDRRRDESNEVVATCCGRRAAGARDYRRLGREHDQDRHAHDRADDESGKTAEVPVALGCLVRRFEHAAFFFSCEQQLRCETTDKPGYRGETENDQIVAGGRERDHAGPPVRSSANSYAPRPRGLKWRIWTR